jgi:4-hydroxy-tetrahydrodipicolinate synthase
MTTRLTGCGTALVTPFTAGGTLDEPALRALVEWQIAEGVHFLVPVGSTGEAATMDEAELRRVVEVVVDQANGRVPVMAGAGSNDTAKAVRLSKLMAAAGATHLLHVSPMYNKPPQRGIVEHFRRVVDATDLPVCVYNVPGRTGSNLEAATTLALAELPHVVAIKEASGNWAQMNAILAGRPAHFSVLSGDDAFTLPLLAAGGDGVISVVSNATPRAMAELVNAGLAGDFAAARELHHRLLPWMEAAFLESNPIPVKAALHLMGKIAHSLRLPLVHLDKRHEAAVRAALQAAGVRL